MTKHTRPDRVRTRPDPAQWHEDELLTLGEAAALYWPDGPLTETTLRTAARDGRLPISQIAGKFFVTKAALRCLTVCKPLGEAHRSPAPVAATGDQGYLADLAQVSEMRRRSKEGASVR
ncbi:hypothetical protein [Afipia broomeae]|uniref:Uncharacterized protein n=1 Tax=Afipia broomeae ATCC 49717 TaxID=883078 RepID=K8NZ79_9BRAD|nr:hypothetical protein [Afipia broomeae]EKS34516.1 hypothetical protein HMPREF9695_04426 [Afipia broomeae ATCC 49717]